MGQIKGENQPINRITNTEHNPTNGSKDVTLVNGSGEFDSTNPLPVQDVDSSSRPSLNSTFGDKIVASRTPSLAAQFVYPLATEDISPPVIVGSGSFDYDNNMLNLRTGTTAGSSFQVSSSSYLRYIPGYQSYAFFTVVFDSDKDKNQEAGIYDFDDGFALRFKEDILSFVRFRDGSEIETINIDYNNIDMGNGPLDPTKGNIYLISYGYLGFAPITLSVIKPNNEIIDLAEFEYPNSATIPHLAQTLLPVSAKIESINGSTIDGALSIGSLNAGIVDGTIDIGGANDVTSRNFHKISPLFNGSDGVVIAYRNKTTFQSIENRVSSLLKRIGIAVDGNKTVTMKLLKQPSFDSATWTDVNTADSTLEFSTNMVLTAGAEDGETFLSWELGRADSIIDNVNEQNLLLPPGGVAVFYIESSQTTEVRHDIRWAELF